MITKIVFDKWFIILLVINFGISDLDIGLLICFPSGVISLMGDLPATKCGTSSVN